MTDFLADMARSSGERVAAARQREPEAALRRRAFDAPASPPLRRSPLSFDLIAEIKLRSPAAGALRSAGEPLQFVSQQARQYGEHGAAAVSVLTEPTRFDGALAHLQAASAAARVPTMRKDFLVDAYQVWEARAHGAGGVLLILQMLDDARLHELLAAAQEAGLFCLLECFDEQDLARAKALWQCATAAQRAAWLFGLNCRNLRTLQIEPQRFAALAGGFPGAAPRVAESGLHTPEDCARVAMLGYDMALVGEALMKSADSGRALSAFLRAGRAAREAKSSCSSTFANPGALPHQIRVKICGLTQISAVQAAVEAGADAIGLVFDPSPRQVSLEQAAELRRALPPTVACVAVFRTPTATRLDEVLARVSPDVLQFDDSALADVYSERVRVLRVFRDTPEARAAAQRFASSAPGDATAARALLFESRISGAGALADWDFAAALATRSQLVLAGGLNPENVAEAIARVWPAAVDVSSGVESAPGKKDAARIRAFIDAARGAASRQAAQEHER